jgi:RND family efflux transporter MFP subunit
MRKLLFILMLFPSLVRAHGGEDHSEKKETSLPVTSYFSTETISDKYEMLLNYAPIMPGKTTAMKLFISNVNTNEPVNPSSVTISIPGLNNKTAVKRLDNGIYELTTSFPDKKAYSLNVSIAGGLGPDLVQLTNIEVGKELPHAHEDEEKQRHASWLHLLGGLLLGVVLTLVGIRLYRKRVNKTIVSAVAFLLLLPLATSRVIAHGGEDHGDKKTTGGTMSQAFRVEKETQFLFGFVTQKLETGSFNESVNVLGTVVPAPGGKAVIQTPQTGKIVSLRVTPGQNVSKGQVLATIEQQVDAGAQIDILTQRNSVNAEYQAAKTQYDRLKSIADIAAKKDVTEAKARYQTALENKKLFEANAGRSSASTKIITLTAPISGVVGAFNYAIGAVVNAGETIFDITNLNNVYVEAQIFQADVEALKNAGGYTTRSSSATNPAEYTLDLLAQPQSVNEENQSQVVLFSVRNPNGQLKIGEKLTVNVKTMQQQRQLVVPNDAITDVNGKPAVFIKDKAEQISISFVTLGQKDLNNTVIVSGAEDGEKIVTQNVYELKMIYLNQ